MTRSIGTPTVAFEALQRALAGIFVVLTLICVGLVSMTGSASADPAQAAALDRLRAQGVLVERFDGFIEVRSGIDAPAEAGPLVLRVNGERRSVYERRARESGTSLQAVGQVYATQIMESAPEGTYFRQTDGSLVRKGG